MNSKQESPKNEKVTSYKYPNTVRFDEEELPEIKSWKVGGRYKLTLEVEQTSQSKGDEFREQEKKPLYRAGFKIISVAPLGVKPSAKSTVLADRLKNRV